MSGFITLQINITGNLEKDQQILLYGIGGLISLIVLSMIIIVIIVIARRVRRNKEAKREATLQASTAPSQPARKDEKSAYEPKVDPEKQSKPEAKAIVADKKEEPAIVLETSSIVKPTIEKKVEPIVAETPKEEKAVVNKEKVPIATTAKELSSSDKMDEIRRRLEEIKGQKKTGPAPVLPKIEAASIISSPVVEKETLREAEPIAIQAEIPAEEIDETIIVEDSESVAVPIDVPAEDVQEEELPPIISEPISEEAEERPRMVEDEGVMKPASEIQLEEEKPESVKEPINHTVSPEEHITTHLPNGKFLPMKKLTFAEWVELFK